MRLKLLIIILAIGVSIVGTIATNGVIQDLNTTDYSIITLALLSALPIILGVSTIVIVIVSLGVSVGGEAKFQWKSYGERLKLAYSAKFSSRDLGFDNEVDYRIKIMVDTDSGYQREVARDWLKRMAKFTNIGWLSLEDNNEKV